MGFKQVVIKDALDSASYYKDITLLTEPKTPRDLYFKLDYLDVLSPDFYNFIKEMEGYIGQNLAYYPGDVQRTPIEIEFEKGKKIEIGCYFENRNLVFLYYDIFKTDLKLGFNNKLLFWFVNALKGWIKQHKLKKVDVRKKAKEAMIEKFVDEVKREIGSLNDLIYSRELSIKNHEDYIIKEVREINMYKKEIESLKLLIKDSKKQVLERLEEVKNFPFVKRLNLTAKGIVVDLDTVKIKYNKKDVKIGRFRLFIRPGSVRLENKEPLIYTKSDGTKMELHHPHIDSIDYACFGERKPMITKLLAGLELKKLVYAIWLFLRSYNPEDKFYKIEYWTGEEEPRENGWS